MEMKQIIHAHLNIFDWVRESKSPPTGVIHPHPLLVSITRGASHGRQRAAQAQGREDLLEGDIEAQRRKLQHLPPFYRSELPVPLEQVAG